MSTEPEKPVSSDVPESSAPDPDSESAPATPPPPPPTAPRDWPPYGSWRRAPVLPLIVIAAVVIMLVAGVSSAAGVLVGIVATKNADSHSRFDRPRHHGPFAPGRREPRRVPRPVPTTPAAPAPATTPPAPGAPGAPSPTTT